MELAGKIPGHKCSNILTLCKISKIKAEIGSSTELFKHCFPGRFCQENKTCVRAVERFLYGRKIKWRPLGPLDVKDEGGG